MLATTNDSKRPAPLNGLITSAVLALLLMALVAFKCSQHASFQTHAYDTGVYSNVAWNVAAGNGFYSTFNELNQLGEHFSPIMAVFAPLYRVWPSAQILMIAQAFAVWLTIVLILHLARLLTPELPPADRAWFAWTCAAMALLYHPLQRALTLEFHPSTLGMPMIVAAIICLHQRRTAPFCLILLFLLSTKELAFLSLVGIGLYAAGVLKMRRVLLACVGLSLLLATAYFLWLQPALRGGRDWLHYGRIDLFTFPGLKLKYLFMLGAYFALLPFLGRWALLAAAPTTLLNLTVGKTSQFTFKAHYDDQNSVFWIIAGMHGLLCAYHWIKQRPPALPWPRLRIAATVILVTCVALGSGKKMIRSIRDASPTASDKKLRSRIDDYRTLPPEVGIFTQNGLGAHLCHRPRCVLLRDEYFQSWPFVPGDYVILSARVDPYPLNDFENAVQKLKTDPRFKPVHSDKYLSVFQAQ